MKKTESAIYKTLAYQAVFDALPTVENLQNFLISGTVVNEEEVGKTIDSLQGIQIVNNFVCVKENRSRVGIAADRLECSKKKIQIARKIAGILKFIPWFKMIGISGAVASFNAAEDDDIDFFVIVAKNRIWLARLCDYILLNLIGVRRNAKSRSFNNKICINFYLSEDNLELKNRDIFTANEVARLIPLYGFTVYNDFIFANKWGSRYLANFWEGFHKIQCKEKVRRGGMNFFLFDYLNLFLGNLQKKFMLPKMSTEKISEREIRFHPKDLRNEVLREYARRVGGG